MNEREKLIEKIKHVQELAERGVDGERESAAAMLEKLMKKHGILEEELKRFLTAFMHLNELFPEDESPQAPTPRTMSKAELFKISSMMMGMDRHEPPDRVKAIEGGEQQCQTE